MLKILILSLALFLVGCSSTEPPNDISTDDAYAVVEDALNQMDDNTQLEILSSGTNDDGRYYMMLSDNTAIFIEGAEVTAINDLLAGDLDVKQSFEFAMAIAEPGLSMGDRNIIYQDVIKNGVHRTDDVTYRYIEHEDSRLLEAER